MNVLLWIAVLGLLVALVSLHAIGARGLDQWGVRPSRAVVALRAFNVTVVVAVVVVAFWKWVG